MTTWHGHHDADELTREELQEWLDQYTPTGIPSHARGEITPFVARTIMLYEERTPSPVTLGKAMALTRGLTRITLWSLACGLPLDVETILDPANVDHWAERGDHPSAKTATQYRADMRLLGPVVTSKAPWERAFRPYYRGYPTPPYTDAEFESLWANADSQSTPARRRVAVAANTLCAGAGLSGGEAPRVEARHIHDPDGEPLIEVTWRRPRLVPLRAAFDDRLRWLLDGARPTDRLMVLGSGRKNWSAAQLLRENDHVGGRRQQPIDPRRLRSSWISHFLEIGTPLKAVLIGAGHAATTYVEQLAMRLPLDFDNYKELLRR
jgi:hypothetical protein